MCSGRVGSSCSTIDTRRVSLVKRGGLVPSGHHYNTIEV
jgi:hypothetical protein